MYGLKIVGTDGRKFVTNGLFSESFAAKARRFIVKKGIGAQKRVVRESRTESTPAANRVTASGLNL